MKLFGRKKEQQSERYDEIAAAEKLSTQNELGRITNSQSEENRNPQQEQ